ncbi:MAG: hypothetical protein ACFN02_11470 [Olsenella profusa]
MVDKACKYVFGIICGLPFPDSNKRMGNAFGTDKYYLVRRAYEIGCFA